MRKIITKESIMRKRRTLLFILMISVITSTCKYNESYHLRITKLEERVDSLETVISTIHTSTTTTTAKVMEQESLKELKYTIDLYNQSMQRINDEFRVVDITTSSNSPGLTITGRIVNSTALKHTNVTFIIKIGDVYKEFLVPVISSGNSTGFTVEVPDAEKDAKNAKIEYLSSTIKYLK
jgi:hypothetical protein